MKIFDDIVCLFLDFIIRILIPFRTKKRILLKNFLDILIKKSLSIRFKYYDELSKGILLWDAKRWVEFYLEENYNMSENKDVFKDDRVDDLVKHISKELIDSIDKK